MSGSVDVTHNGGTGTVTDDDGNEREVDVEWTGHGQLEGTDNEGNTYELEVDQIRSVVLAAAGVGSFRVPAHAIRLPK